MTDIDIAGYEQKVEQFHWVGDYRDNNGFDDHDYENSDGKKDALSDKK